MKRVYIEDFSKHIGEEVEVAGWLYNSRSSGKIIFLLVRYANKLMKKGEDAPAGPTEVDLLTEIRDQLKKRP